MQSKMKKHKTYYKPCSDCRHVRKQRVRRKSQHANNEDNIDTDSDNMNEPLEHRKPTISERLNHIQISLDQVKKQIAQSCNDDVDMLKIKD